MFIMEEVNIIFWKFSAYKKKKLSFGCVYFPSYIEFLLGNKQTRMHKNVLISLVYSYHMEKKNKKKTCCNANNNNTIKPIQ